MSDKAEDKEQAPLMHFRNPRTGVSVWPVQVKDSQGNWVDSDPDAIKSLLRDDFHKPMPKSGKK